MIQQKLPNSTMVLVLGILSILLCWCYGIVGILLAGVALYFYRKDAALYRSNPAEYTGFDVLNAGRILAIIGLVLNVIYIVYISLIFSFIGLDALSDPDLMKERIEELFGN